ncbi:CopG family transcriptional regulator [Asticcacaulis sp.]|uniref:CopG family transcriptional regulator n=1 Tax=Asticcacaulis sp. TaxID=1872648 RepID=UPI002BEC45C7|nr:CopG family transcriptional regulator [Asticcacaulis sp.]HTM81927.1 CopG family transcriptional regulator [Asticcacaulis sp.]
MKTHKIRHQLFLDAPISQRLEALAEKPGMNKSAVLADAVKAWLDRRGTNELDDRFGQRLNRISAQLNRIERDQKIVLESLALFVRLTLLRDAHLPEPDAAARAMARDRFEQFVAQLGRQLSQGSQSLTPGAFEEGM